MSSSSNNLFRKIKVISFDVTGTLLVHKYPIMQTYADSAIWAKLPNPPTAAEWKKPFKDAYYKNLIDYPCFGHKENFSSREWWEITVKTSLQLLGREYSTEEFNRFFRRVYQHYGSLEGYERLLDADSFLAAAKDKYTMGITTNTPIRTVETVLPMLGLHEYFKWFVCCRDVGVEKPGREIFDRTFSEAQFWHPELRREEVLHIGDSLAADFCGARAAGFQALFLDRSENPRVTVYQDWLTAPDYEGKSQEDIALYTVNSFVDVMDKLQLNDCTEYQMLAFPLSNKGRAPESQQPQMRQKKWDNTISIQQIPKRKIQMFRDLHAFKGRLSVDSTNFPTQKNDRAEVFSNNHQKFLPTFPLSSSLESIITNLGFQHHPGTDPLLEMEVIKLIIHREGFLMELRNLSGSILKDKGINEKDGLKVLELLSQLKRCTVAYIEALCLWRQGNNTLEKATKNSQVHQNAQRVFIWEGSNYTIKLTKDLDFLATNSIIVSALGVSSSQQLQSNPLMLPNTLDDMNTWMDPYDRAAVDAENNGEKGDSPQFENRLKLRLAERIILQEIEYESAPTLDKSLVESNINENGEQLDIEIYGEAEKSLDVSIAPLNWAKEWPPQVNGSTGVKQNPSAPPLPPSNGPLSTEDDMNKNSYDDTRVRNNDMFLLGAAPNSIFFVSKDNIEDDTCSTNLLSAAEPTSVSLTYADIKNLLLIFEPPHGLLLSGSACLIIFSNTLKLPRNLSWSNFVKLSENVDLVQALPVLDPTQVPEYKLQALKKYAQSFADNLILLNDDNFTSLPALQQLAAAKLVDWVSKFLKRAINYSNTSKENEKVVSENESKMNSKAAAKGKAPINAAHNKRDLASKKHNEKLDPITNRKNAKAVAVTNAKGNSNRSLVHNPNDVQGEPLRGKIRPLSSSTLALSRAANSTGAGAAPAGGTVPRGGSRAKSAGPHRAEVDSEECKRRSKGMIALHTELFSNNSFSMLSSLLIVLFIEPSSSKHELLDLIVKVHDIVTSEEIYFSLSTNEFNELLESLCAANPKRQMEIRSLFRPRSSDWWAKNISNWIVRSADVKKVEAYVKKELQLLDELVADTALVGISGDQYVETSASTTQKNTPLDDSDVNVPSEVEWTDELFHQDPIEGEELEADEPFQQLYVNDSADGLGFEPASTANAIGQGSYGDDFEQKESLLKSSMHQHISYGEDFESDFATVAVSEQQVLESSVLVPIEENKVEEERAVSAAEEKEDEDAKRPLLQRNESRPDLQAPVESLVEGKVVEAAIPLGIAESPSPQRSLQIAVDYEDEFEKEAQHVLDDNNDDDNYEQVFSPTESVKFNADTAAYPLNSNDGDEGAEMKNETASIASGYGSYGEDFDNEAAAVPSYEKEAANEYKDDGSDEYAADKPESEEENDELGYANVSLQETSQVRYGEDFENENSSSIMKSYGFAMSSSIVDMENDTDSAIMLRAPPNIPGTGRSDRSESSSSPPANQPQVKSNPLAVNESVNDKDDYSAYSKDQLYEEDSKEGKPVKNDAMDLESSYSQDGDFVEKNKDVDNDSPQQHQQQQKQKLQRQPTSDKELFDKYVDDHEGDIDLSEFIDEDSCDSYRVPDSIAKDLQKVRVASAAGKS